MPREYRGPEPGMLAAVLSQMPHPPHSSEQAQHTRNTHITPKSHMRMHMHTLVPSAHCCSRAADCVLAGGSDHRYSLAAACCPHHGDLDRDALEGAVMLPLTAHFCGT